MYELLLTVCLMSDPSDCTERRLPFQERMGAMGCMRAGQSHARRWLETHPTLVLESWRCVTERRSAEAGDGFALEEIAPGVFVHVGAVALPSAANAGDIANAGFVVGEEAVAAIDAGGSRAVGERLLGAIRAVTEKPVRWLVLTHMHPDHVLGAEVFREAGATVIGHANLARALRNRAETYETSYARLLGPRAFAGTEAILPDEGVEAVRELDLGGRVLELIPHPTAHTDNDLTVYDRETGTWWVGDLVFEDHAPALDGSLTGWISVLEEMQGRGAERIVPGHGPASLPWPGGAANTLAYLRGLAEAVRAAIDRGETMGEAIQSAGADLGEGWRLFEEYHPRNVSAAFQELEWE
jgi:quinoprotein relay system zinc metallohydrolase 2